jgi:NhaA family Na+:H+ antiporter
MTLFFFVVALELKRELVLGELRDWRRAALAFFAALGGLWASGGRPGTEGAGVASSRAVMASSKTRAGQRR